VYECRKSEGRGFCKCGTPAYVCPTPSVVRPKFSVFLTNSSSCSSPLPPSKTMKFFGAIVVALATLRESEAFVGGGGLARAGAPAGVVHQRRAAKTALDMVSERGPVVFVCQASTPLLRFLLNVSVCSVSKASQLRKGVHESVPQDGFLNLKETFNMTRLSSLAHQSTPTPVPIALYVSLTVLSAATM